MAALVTFVACDSRRISSDVIPAKTGRKVVSVGRMQPVMMHMVSLRLESSLGT